MVKSTLGNTAFWIFHGDKDNVVSYHFSKQMFRKMKRFNKDTKFTSYKGVYHESWNNAIQRATIYFLGFFHLKNRCKNRLLLKCIKQNKYRFQLL